MPAVHLTPVQCAVEAFGNMSRLAAALGHRRSTVHRWQRSRDLGGCGGFIPTSSEIRRILDLARLRGLALTADDLICGRDAA